LDYVQEALARTLDGDVSVAECNASNLCASYAMRVSNSGATVLRLSLELADGRTMNVVLKVLSVDSCNIFKIDRCFDARQWETALMRWWGDQGLPQLPVVYDVRSEPLAREYWILYEYFPHVGWTHTDEEPDVAAMERVVEHAAFFHAYTRDRLDQLQALQPDDGTGSGSLCPPSTIALALEAELADTKLLTDTVGLSDDERAVLADSLSLIENRSGWVDEWDYACVNRDFSVSNTAVRETPDGPQLVSFDWGAAHLGPMEQDIDVLLGRDFQVDETTQEALVRHYLEAYTDLTGRQTDYAVFMARIPWARLLEHLRSALEQMKSLKWMPWQSRSHYLIHLNIGLAKGIAAGLK
jgi:hypothetical protein